MLKSVFHKKHLRLYRLGEWRRKGGSIIAKFLFHYRLFFP